MSWSGRWPSVTRRTLRRAYPVSSSRGAGNRRTPSPGCGSVEALNGREIEDCTITCFATVGNRRRWQQSARFSYDAGKRVLADLVQHGQPADLDRTIIARLGEDPRASPLANVDGAAQAGPS